jgi:hypothetical protein
MSEMININESSIKSPESISLKKQEQVKTYLESLDKRISLRAIEFSKLLEQTGGQIERMGKNLIRLGLHLESFFNQSESPTGSIPIKSERKIEDDSKQIH